MEALSQLDIHSPDHVSVITRDGKMTVSITKDGASVTVSMPVRQPIPMATALAPLQQSELQQIEDDVKRMEDELTSKGQTVAELSVPAEAAKVVSIAQAAINKASSTRKTSYIRSTSIRRDQRNKFGMACKLNEKMVKEIRAILDDRDLMNKFRSKTNAYDEIGKAYNVTGCTIRNIDVGLAWRHVM